MTARLGIVDWGIGGLGVVRELHAEYMRIGATVPGISYLSDTGSQPYGMLSAPDLEARLRRAIRFLRERGASKILLACNAASTALPRLSDLENVTGVIAPTLALVGERRTSEPILIIGGRRTILSRVYANALRRRGFVVAQRIAQPLSGMIERGEQQSPSFERAVAIILGGQTHYSALLLACTHYPAAFATFAKLFPGTVVDPLPAIARACVDIDFAPRGEQPPHAFFTSGDADAMKAAAVHAWGDAFATIRPRHVTV